MNSAMVQLPHGADASLVANAIITSDERGVIRSWSRGAETLFGYTAPEIVGRPLAVLVPAERVAAGELERFRRDLDAHGVRVLETDRLSKDGRHVRVTAICAVLLDRDGRAVGYCWVFRNVEVDYALLSQLFYESEKLAALGAMASGVVHEIGNPLAGVLGLLQLAERKTAEPETRGRLTHVRSELFRVGQIVRELTDFTRADGEEGAIDVNAVIQSALVFARYAYPALPVTVEVALDGDVPALVGSRTHFLQACLDLLMNAYDALGESGGFVAVRSSHANGEIVIRIEDTGRGMTPAVRARIFEPFFTTKTAAAGTGLGLFVCRRVVVEELGGRIDVDSRPEAGTRFTLTLPLDRGALCAKQSDGGSEAVDPGGRPNN